MLGEERKDQSRQKAHESLDRVLDRARRDRVTGTITLAMDFKDGGYTRGQMIREEEQV